MRSKRFLLLLAVMVFCMPGSSGAVRLAMEKLIVPELSHLVWEIWRQK